MNKVIIFPTDTVYGIGTPILDKEGIRKIYEIKGRDFNKPLAVLCSNLDQMTEFGYVTDDAVKLAKAFWPGALTLILKSKPDYAKESGEVTIGVRMPNHPLALKIIAMHGPMKTTSVNNSGEAPLNDYAIIKERYADKVDYIYPNDQKLSEVSSTVVDLTQDEPKILRLGDITLEDIKKVLQK
ncbi:threonylcarbamoyl-AMP synthase [Acholeplasma equirhinis]|uniref:L-threonylcarbamoyladenylate synthase n=1 Tax=Acholeplasma equirhinis TaxID=555393 RepID=UPI00197AE657|nr:L-threonylcarbamoyladenylate synthase [Acholeplasma equirhinis]MBN3490849.1 threonylcarbamoyl-AMP synthase [Acholeplasma equirhinis]